MAEAARVIPLRPLERTGTGIPNEVWDACEEVLGYPPRTRTEQRLWGQMTTSLREAGATRERIHAVATWYRRHWPGIDLTIAALEKWYSHFLRMEEERNKTQSEVCKECEMGGGRHVSGCPNSKG